MIVDFEMIWQTPHADTILDKDFDGALPNVIRNLLLNIGAFLKTSGYLFQISDEPEYPFISVDEAIVNAVIHRDYAVNISDSLYPLLAIKQ